MKTIRATIENAAFQAGYFLASCWCELSGIANGLPVPPPKLVWLVGGHQKIVRNLKNGILSSENIRHALSKNGLRIDDFPELLDFGCGSGRIVRNWKRLPTTQIHGTDYNAEPIGWCKAHLPFAHFHVNQLAPPLDWADEKFSFIYAVSVFTHLDEPLQHAWIAELRRVLKPGGYLLFTTHGDLFRKLLSENECARFDAGQLVVRNGDEAGRNVCAVFHPAEWVKEHLMKGFALVDFIPEGATGTGKQDIYLLKKAIP